MKQNFSNFSNEWGKTRSMYKKSESFCTLHLIRIIKIPSKDFSKISKKLETQVMKSTLITIINSNRLDIRETSAQ